eukprot:70657-Alexandrium_andersonii.AAC.1
MAPCFARHLRRLDLRDRNLQLSPMPTHGQEHLARRACWGRGLLGLSLGAERRTLTNDSGFG